LKSVISSTSLIIIQIHCNLYAMTTIATDALI